MNFLKALTLLAIAGTATSFSLSMRASGGDLDAVDRRGFVRTTVAGIATAATFSNASPVLAQDEDPYADYTTTESGLKYMITKEGDGAVPAAGQQVKAQYTGWLDGFDSIRKFDSSTRTASSSIDFSWGHTVKISAQSSCKRRASTPPCPASSH